MFPHSEKKSCKVESQSKYTIQGQIKGVCEKQLIGMLLAHGDFSSKFLLHVYIVILMLNLTFKDHAQKSLDAKCYLP